MLYIAKQTNDGTVRYIAMNYDNHYPAVPRILQTFYNTDSRIDALLTLGNIVKLQPSPYGKWKGYEDPVNCRAEIRDDKAHKGRHLAQYAESVEEYARKEGHLFIRTNRGWLYKTAEGFKPLKSTHIPFTTSQSPFKDIKLYQFSNEGDLTGVNTRQLSGWKELQAKAAVENQTYFAFRGEKLVATINHPLNK